MNNGSSLVDKWQAHSKEDKARAMRLVKMTEADVDRMLVRVTNASVEEVDS